jgi:tetratricopeptide (TPR) repeat protein
VVTGYSRIRRQRLIQEAEGYLDLILAVSDPLPVDANHRSRLARRAIAVLDQLDHVEFCHGRAHYLRGQAFRLMEKYHQAIDAFQKAATIDPLNVHIMLATAWCHKRIGRIDLAIETLEEALDVDPDRAIVHYNLACYWSLTQNVGLVLAHLARAFELQPEYRNLVHEEPDFDCLRSHPEFLALSQLIV